MRGAHHAAVRARNDQVRQFGQRMVDDHSRANQQLQQIAASNGIPLPSGPDRKHHVKAQELQSLSGARFDRAYMHDMVEDHRKDIALFEKEAKRGRNADLRQFAEHTLPTLREHYDLAKRTEASLEPAQAGATHGKGHGTMSSGSSGTMNRATGSSQAQ